MSTQDSASGRCGENISTKGPDWRIPSVGLNGTIQNVRGIDPNSITSICMNCLPGSTQPTSQPLEDETEGTLQSKVGWATLYSTSERLGTFQITGSEIIIGRNPSCAILVTDQRISQFHCRISMKTESSSDTMAILEDKRFLLSAYFESVTKLIFLRWNFYSVRMEHILINKKFAFHKFPWILLF